MARASFCLNHVERSATANCAQCFRPLCTECRVPFQDKIFCSGGCQEQFSRFYKDGVFRRKRSIVSRLLPALVPLALLAAAVYGAGTYLKIPWAVDLLAKLGLK